jgi:signal transduction histidine kinase
VSVSLNDNSLRRLLDVGRALVEELDVEAVLERVLEEACAITDARYAALGVLNEDRTGLERFLTRGIDPTTHRAIGDLPHGRGVLGVLIEDPRPLRLRDVGSHPYSYGFPARHPEMNSFLGVPILTRSRTWGNLYLTQKHGGGEFTQQDEDAATVLAQWAGTAIANARLYESSERRREEAERGVRSLEAARDIADAVGGITDLDRVLELVVKRGRALVDARTVLIMLVEGDDLVVAASAGHASDAKGRRFALAQTTSGQVLQRGRPHAVTDVATELRIGAHALGVTDAKTALLVPLLYHGHGIGVLAAFDRGELGGQFSAADEQLLRTFAASAASAVALNRSVQADRLRSAIAAADAERGRWARELHDQTLQSLGGLRVLLAAALRRGDESNTHRAVDQAIEDIEYEIENLRAIISDLRPSLLDDLGLLPAIDAFVERRREGGLQISTGFDLPPDVDEKPLAPELETTIYRVVQEAVTNVVKHADASVVRVLIESDDGQILVEVRDNGRGFDVTTATKGFGLSGLRERVYLAGGTLELTSGQQGTLVRARLPDHRAIGAGSSGGG